MKTMALFATLALIGCATPHIEDTAGQAGDSLAKVAVIDKQARLVKVDGAAVEAPTIGSYYLKPGTRHLEFSYSMLAPLPLARAWVAQRRLIALSAAKSISRPAMSISCR